MISLPTHKTKKGYVYLMGDSNTDNNFKIGVTNGTLENRIKKLQTGNSGEIFLVSYFETDYPFYVEGRMHSKHMAKQVLNEWYELTPDDVVHFKDDCKAFEDIALSLSENPFFKP